MKMLRAAEEWLRVDCIGSDASTGNGYSRIPSLRQRADVFDKRIYLLVSNLTIEVWHDSLVPLNNPGARR